MNKKRKILFIAPMLLVLIVCIIGFFTMHHRSEPTIPDEVSTLVKNYMDAYKNGTEYSVEYAHFEDEFKRSAYITTGDKLLDYKIESADKINDNLYALTILVKTEQSTFYSGDVFERAYNFVAQIDDGWYFLNGVSNIPSDIQDNLDVSEYTYDDENIVDRDDIVGIIDID